jgi:hypothetical protein
MVSEPTMTSFLRFTLLAQQAGLNWSLDTMVNESLVTRARNNLMAKMMTNKEATHFIRYRRYYIAFIIQNAL